MLVSLSDHLAGWMVVDKPIKEARGGEKRTTHPPICNYLTVLLLSLSLCFAGVVMALGLQGHLSVLSNPDISNYLTQVTKPSDLLEQHLEPHIFLTSRFSLDDCCAGS